VVPAQVEGDAVDPGPQLGRLFEGVALADHAQGPAAWPG
jgi:hypothetical protein